jgi:hypothetical protein
MSSNLLQTAKELLTPDLLARAGSQLGESQDAVAKALTSGVVPLLLSGLSAKVEQGGASDILAQSSLVSLGVAEGRLEAEGYGEQHPVASNATDEGRAQNRRIAMRVTSR